MLAVAVVGESRSTSFSTASGPWHLTQRLEMIPLMSRVNDGGASPAIPGCMDNKNAVAAKSGPAGGSRRQAKPCTIGSFLWKAPASPSGPFPLRPDADPAGSIGGTFPSISSNTGVGNSETWDFTEKSRLQDRFFAQWVPVRDDAACRASATLIHRS